MHISGRAGRRSAPAVVTLVLLLGGGLVGGAAPAVADGPERAPVVATPVVDTGAVPASGFEVDPAGRVFYGGRTDAKVRLWSPVTGLSTVFATVPSGRRLLGLTLHPAFPSTPYVYASVVRRVGSADRIQLVRFTADGAVGKGFRLLRDVTDEGTDHSGGKLTFSADGKALFLVVGDGGTATRSQDLADQHGKLLRLTPLGAPAPGNPFGTAVYAYGLRNSIGLSVDPVTKALWETENGPECGDELNRIRAGGNYGWGPSATCAPGTVAGTNQDGPTPRVLPKKWYATPSAPTGGEFCDACGLAGVDGSLVYGRFLQKDLRVVGLNAARTAVVSERTLFSHDDNVLAVERDPRDGSLWFSDFGAIYRLTD